MQKAAGTSICPAALKRICQTGWPGPEPDPSHPYLCIVYGPHFGRGMNRLPTVPLAKIDSEEATTWDEWFDHHNEHYDDHHNVHYDSHRGLLPSDEGLPDLPELTPETPLRLRNGVRIRSMRAGSLAMFDGNNRILYGGVWARRIVVELARIGLATPASLATASGAGLQAVMELVKTLAVLSLVTEG